MRDYSLDQRCMFYVLLVSLLLQSCNHPSNPLVPLKEAQEQLDQQADREQLAKQVYIKQEEVNSIVTGDHLENMQALVIAADATTQETIPPSPPQSTSLWASTTLGDFDKLPREVVKIIFSYAGSKGMSQVRQLSKASYKLTTGYDKPKLGVEHKPQASILTDRGAVTIAPCKHMEDSSLG